MSGVPFLWTNNLPMSRVNRTHVWPSFQFDNFCCCFSLLLFCKVILRCTHILKTDVFSFYLSISLSPFSLWVHWRLYIRVLLLSIVESSTRLHNKATRPSTFLPLSRGWNISFVADCKYWWGLKNCVFVRHFDMGLF